MLGWGGVAWFPWSALVDFLPSGATLESQSWLLVRILTHIEIAGRSVRDEDSQGFLYERALFLFVLLLSFACHPFNEFQHFFVFFFLNNPNQLRQSMRNWLT